MEAFRGKFEAELKVKLAQKSTSQVSEENVLLRSFKYFDLDNSESVDFNEFTKAIEKVGVVVLDPAKLQELFNIYDEDRSGALNYKEFVGGIFGQASSTGRQVTPRKSFTPADSTRAEALLEQLRGRLVTRGTRGMIGLARLFKIMDDDNSKLLDLYEFNKGLRDYRLDLSEADAQLLFRYIDRDNSGKLDYDEFLRFLRGPMNQFRSNFVSKAFDKLDATRNGVVDLEDIRQFYNARGHPDVRSGKKSEEDILMEFLDTFEVHHSLLTGDRGDRRITREEFEEYYNHVSASIDDDAYFELMMTNTWKLAEVPAYAKNKAWRGDSPSKTASQRAEASDLPKHLELLLERFRSKVAARGVRGILGIARHFRIMDDDRSGTISLGEMRKANHDFRLDMEDADIEVIFNGIDRDRSGFIDYDELLRAVRGPMNEARRSIVKQAWRKIDRDGNGLLEVDDLVGIYSGRMHPDVRAGKKTEEEVLGEFLETFEIQLSLSGKGQRDRSVTWEEFEEYYNNVSASIDDDAYFETMMINAWKLQGEGPLREAWAGGYRGRDFKPNSKQQWMNDHHRSAIAGSTSAAAPYGTDTVEIDWGTTNRPSTAQSDLLRASSSAKPAGQSSWPEVPTTKSGSKETPQESLLEQFRTKLKGRGARGLIGLARQFKIMDDDRSGALSYPEFKKGLKDFRIDMTEDQARQLFSVFDPDRSGSIDYEEFIHRVRGVLNDARRAVVHQAFNKLDRTGDGVVELEDLRGVYDASKHPDVRIGKRTEDEILGDFLDTFEQHHSMFVGTSARDKRVTLGEFEEYYAHISASIDDDRYFELMVKTAWNLEGRSSQAAWAGDMTGPAARPKRR
jgi:Ca2+-binding EF-hand superfamily protein